MANDVTKQPLTRFGAQTAWVSEAYQDKGLRGLKGYAKGAAYGLWSVGSLAMKVVASAGYLVSSEAYSVTKSELPALKAHIGMPDSCLNRSQLERVYDCWNLSFRPTAERLAVIGTALGTTESALDSFFSPTTKTSDAVRDQNRFFAFEGAKLVNEPTTSDMIAAKKELVGEIHAYFGDEMYTPVYGDSKSSVRCDEYVLNKIMKSARDQGLTTSYLDAVEKEVAKLPEAQRKSAALDLIAQGVQNGILRRSSPTVRAELVSIVANGITPGTSPDAQVQQATDQLIKDGLVPSTDRAAFVADVLAQTGKILDGPKDPVVVPPSAPSTDGTTGGTAVDPSALVAPAVTTAPTLMERFAKFKQERAEKAAAADAEKTRLKAAAELEKANKIKAAEDGLPAYEDALKALIDAQKELSLRFGNLIPVMQRLSVDGLDSLSKDELAGLVRHMTNGGVNFAMTPAELQEKYVELHAAVTAQKEEVVRLIKEVVAKAPADFKMIAKEKRKSAGNLEAEAKSLDKQNNVEFEKAKKLRKAMDVLEQREIQQQAQVVERFESSTLPDAAVEGPAVEKKPGFFSNLFQRKVELPDAVIGTEALPVLPDATIPAAPAGPGVATAAPDAADAIVFPDATIEEPKKARFNLKFWK